MHKFKLFIYGSLKLNGTGHHLLAGKYDSKTPAQINGTLFTRKDDQIPYITVPGKYILSRGSHDYTKDASLLTKTQVPEQYAPSLAAGWVQGELYTITDFTKVMQIIDLFEDFTPGHESEYDRVLYPVRTGEEGSFELAWVYVIANNHAEEGDIQIESGIFE